MVTIKQMTAHLSEVNLNTLIAPTIMHTAMMSLMIQFLLEYHHAKHTPTPITALATSITRTHTLYVLNLNNLILNITNYFLNMLTTFNKYIN